MNFAKIAILRARWVPARLVGDKLDQVVAANGSKLVKLRRNLIAVDVSFRGGKPDAVKIALVHDHPHKRYLPANAPRACKAVFRSDVRLSFLRSDEAWLFMAAERAASEAWDKFTRAVR